MHSPPLGLYLHMPWCVRKCPYCDFNSHALKAGVDTAAYVKALLSDLEFELTLTQGRSIESIFIGGGTPSLFPGADIAHLLEGVRARTELSPDCEITLEANPGAVDAERFSAYRAAGVNRLSIGVQSLNDVSLRALGRVHNAAEAQVAVATARAAGFDNINLDMMFGLPQQSIDDGLADLAAGLALDSTHFSWYQLTLEPNTAFHHAPPPLPEHDDLMELQDAGQALLAQAGFRQYEVSAYAKSGRRCAHNENYWRFGDYLGVGAGAHGKLSLPDPRMVRRWRVKHPDTYLQLVGSPSGALAGERLIQPEVVGVEFLMNALRLRDGVDEALFSERTGQDLALIQADLQQARARGLLEPNKLRATDLGWRFLNDLIGIFEPE